MDEYHRNLIAAFADGSLDDEKTAVVEALLADDETARRELAAHRAALAALRAAPAPALTQSERERLHGQLIAQLNLDTEVVPETSPRRPRFSWAAIAVAAAALVGVVAAAPLLNLLTTGGGDAQPVALAPTTTAASEQLVGDFEQAADAEAPPIIGAPDTIGAAAETTPGARATTIVESATAQELVPDLGKVVEEDLQNLESVYLTSGTTDFVTYVRDDARSSLVPWSEIESAYGAFSDEGLFDFDAFCVDELAAIVTGPADRELVAVAELEGRPVAVFLILPVDDDGGSALVTIDIETCDILSLAL